MARGIYGAGLQGISGSINSQAGGWTFGKNGVIRRRVTPTNPQTASQQEIRAAFLFLTAYWSGTLNDSQRAAWEAARSGSAYFTKQDPLTGTNRPYGSAKDLFIAMNMNHIVASDILGSLAVDYLVPGAPSTLDSITGVSVAADASAGTVALTFTGTFAAEDYTMRMTPPLNVGNAKTTSFKSKFRTIGVGSPTSPTALGTAYVAKFGAITGATGQKIFWEMYGSDIATGKNRLIASGSTVIVA